MFNTANYLGNPCVLGKSNTLFTNEILYFEGDINYTYVHLASGKQKLLAKTLLVVENTIASDAFVRISRKHLVNRKFIVEVGKDFVVLSNHLTLPIARRRRRVLR
ncbi:MAG: LytTR family transcriptional regulator [Arcicella sp.]|jgi:DNA-binding LytR/AlgR family response regulator|nr:LytTR family transcriptional regulator [Arcicella sp.]